MEARAGAELFLLVEAGELMAEVCFWPLL